VRADRHSGPRVVVASGGTFHAYHLARGVHAAGWLHRFITTIFNPLEAGLPRGAVVELPWPAYVARLIAALPIARRQTLAYLVGDSWFDRAASRRLDGADLYHGFNNQALQSVRVAKRQGMITIVERASAHPDAHHELLRDEFARFGLTAPTADRRLRDRHVAEYAEADWVMVPSDLVHRSMIERGVPASKLRRVHLGVETQRFSPGPKRDDCFRVLFVGAISLQKGLPYLLEGFRLARFPGQRAELVLVGEPFPEAAVFLRPYAGEFRHVASVPHDRLAREYHQASVFVLPSLQEGFGMVVYEAAACGLPVIVSDRVGALVRDGRDGFVVPARDAEAIAEKLTYFYEHEDERRRMGESARTHVSQFTWQRYHRELVAHYREILGS
jgi:glycosyltransferase involved in cell wall biosynthesis